MTSAPSTGKSFIAAALGALLGLLVVFSTALGASAPPETTLQRLRTGTHGATTRVVLDVEGARPLRVGPGGAGVFSVAFKGLETVSDPVSAPIRRGAILRAVEMKQLGGASELRFLLRSPETRVRHFFLAGEPSGKNRYRLVLDFSPEKPEKGRAGPPPLAAPQAARAPQAAPPAPSAPPPAEPPRSAPPPLVAAPAPLVPEAPASPQSARREAAKPEPASPPEPSRAASGGPAVVPPPALSPAELLRHAIALRKAGNNRRANEILTEVVTRHPGDPAAGPCWTALGDGYAAESDFPRAAQAYRAALQFSLEPTERERVTCALAGALVAAGEFAEGVALIEKAAREDPSLTRRRPEVLRHAGEAAYGLGQYRLARDNLLQYLNLDAAADRKDVLLARIADAVGREGDSVLADRLFAYIGRAHEGSEGDVIGRIRKAERDERGDGAARKTALEAYEDLAAKPLPPALSRLVHYRIARFHWDEGRHARSLDVIEEALRSTPGPAEDLTALRDRVATDCLAKAFAAGNHFEVARLHAEYRARCPGLREPAVELKVAESCVRLGLYARALELYEGLLPRDPSPAVRLAAARAALLGGDSARALALAEAAPPGAAEREILLGEVRRVRREYAEAVRHFEAAQKALPAGLPPAAMLLYGESLGRSGRAPEGLAVLGKAASGLVDPPPETALRLSLATAACALEAQRPREALAAFESALPLAPQVELRNQIAWEISNLCATLGETSRAADELGRLKGSGQPLWKAAAEQRLHSMRMNGSPADYGAAQKAAN